jgi:phage portal protein BeeE
LSWLANISGAIKTLTGATARVEPSQRVSGLAHSIAGIAVGPDTALRLGAVWRAVNLLSSSVGTLPCKIYREDSETSGKSPDKADPRSRLVRRKANSEMSAAIFRQTITAHALLRGNGIVSQAREIVTEAKAFISACQSKFSGGFNSSS